MSKTVPIHRLILTYHDHRQETFRYPSLDFALAVFEKLVAKPGAFAKPHGLWNVAIYNRHDDCLRDYFSEQNRVSEHVQKQGEDLGSLKHG